MKFLLILSALFLLTVSATNCGNNTPATAKTPYKGKLETKAICMNYTLRLLEGTIDTSMISGDWTDESTGKTYKNVFALGNPCTFPSTIKEGDEFYFEIDTIKDQKQCIACMAYYPTPPKKLFIKVVDK